MDKYSYSDDYDFPIEISSKYEIIHEIGRGAFSKVYKVKSRENNNIYCLKKINTKKTKDKENEIKILSNLSHPNLIKCFFSFYDSENIYIIMDFCEFGDLFSLLQSVKKKKVFVNEDIIWNIAIQVLIGLNYLHSKKIIHRDIKLLNLFMTREKKVKIGDMGMSIVFDEDESINSRVGTPLYIAPELVKKENYDYKIDIWSLGCSLYHLAKTVPPFTDDNLIKLGNSIINDQPSNLPVCYSNELYNFILKLMVKNKDERPSAIEALELIPENIKRKFYKNYNLYSLKKKKFKYENGKLMQNVINRENKIMNNLDNANNNKENIIKLDKYISKSIKNENKLNNKFDNSLISGQTFYQFFKVNNIKNKNTYKNINEITNNEKSNISNNINYNNTKLLLSKTMVHMNENFNKFKNKEKSETKPDIFNNIKGLKLMNNKDQQKNESEKKITNKEIKENKEIENFDNKNFDDYKKDKINNINNINSSELIKYTLERIRNDENKNHKNISISLDKYIKNKDINKLYLRNFYDSKRNFLIKEIINKNNTIFTNKMNMINTKYQIDNKKEETLLFPKIQNRYKFKSSSAGRYKNFQDFQNFVPNAFNNNFKNKLTIHDLK